MVNNIQIKEIAEKINLVDYEHNYIGIRVEEEQRNSIGETMEHNSSIWVDGEELEEKLNGVCAIDKDRVNELSNVTYNGYMGNIVLILGSDKAECGEDAGEIIMDHPIVLDIIAMEE